MLLQVPEVELEPICTDCKKFMQDIKDLITSQTAEVCLVEYIWLIVTNAVYYVIWQNLRCPFSTINFSFTKCLMISSRYSSRCIVSFQPFICMSTKLDLGSIRIKVISDNSLRVSISFGVSGRIGANDQARTLCSAWPIQGGGKEKLQSILARIGVFCKILVGKISQRSLKKSEQDAQKP